MTNKHEMWAIVAITAMTILGAIALAWLNRPAGDGQRPCAVTSWAPYGAQPEATLVCPPPGPVTDPLHGAGE